MSRTDTTRWVFRLTAVMLLLAMTIFLVFREPKPVDRLLAVDRFGPGPASYGEEAAAIAKAVHASSRRADHHGDSWLADEYLAMAIHRDGQLSGDFDRIEQASDILNDARAIAPDGSGPLLSSAIVAFSAHRNSEASDHLVKARNVAVNADRIQRAEQAALAGDLALYRGQYRDAERLYQSSANLAPGVEIALRIANLHQRMGEFDEGVSILADALNSAEQPSRKLAAVTLLSAGGMELKRGDWVDARKLFERAEQVFPGYWLASAHIAQLDAAEGQYEEAFRRYRSILSRHDEPSVMQAYASALSAQGRDKEAEALEGRAANILLTKIADAPEAFADHALDAAIGAGDAKAATRFAELNYAARPYGDSIVGVARALNLAGKPAEAIELLQGVEESGWRSTEQYLTLAESCAALDQLECVQNARAKARAFNSKAFDPGSELLAFGNH